MPSPYTSYVGFGQLSDPEETAINRQKEMAAMLRQQSMTPIEGNQVVAGRVIPVSWAQGLAKVLQGYASGLSDQRTDESTKKLISDRQNARTEDLKKYTDLLRGGEATYAPSMALKPNEDGTLQQVQTAPARTADPQGAYASLLASRDPGLQQMGAQGMATLPQLEQRKQDREDQRQFQREQLAEQLRARKEAQEANFENQRILKSLGGGGGGAQPYFQPVDTGQGIYSFNARTGQVAPVSVNGQPIIKSGSDPTLQGRITGAKQTAEAEAKRDFNMAGVTGIINQAESVLGGTGDKKPTSSMIGNVIDKSAAMVGQTPRGAQQADELKVLGGYLVSKMPRMEGPQSNYDVQNYKEMAGDVGNPNLPIERRQAALRQLRQIVAKYDKGAPQSAPTPSMGNQDQQALEWARANPNDPRAAQIRQRLGQ